MVERAPTFAEIADALAERLHGKLLVAHNARFDYGFLRNEFRRLGIDFSANVVCTVSFRASSIRSTGGTTLTA
jgi:DNA polymerase-3 subunit epsilon